MVEIKNSSDNKAPINYEQWIDSGRIIIPCMRGKPILKRWSSPDFKITKEQWKNDHSNCEIALRVDYDIDLDIDNPLAKGFIEKYVKSCGAVSGRNGNPHSHYWWRGKVEFKQFKLPAELKEHYKDLPHGSMICELRSGSDKYTIVPESKHSKANEIVRWEKYSGMHEYTGNLREDVGKVALSTALCLLYAPVGQRDIYCTAIAGVLLKHTNWDVNEIDEFIDNLAIEANDDEAIKRRSKGTSGKKANKNLGLPKLAEIIGCSPRAVAELFSWIGIKYAAGKEIAEESIGDIIEYGANRYIVKVNAVVQGEPVEKEIIVDGPTLMNQKLFYDAVIKQSSVWIPKMKANDFEIVMRKKFESRTKSEDYVAEAEEDQKFEKHFDKYIKLTKIFTDKKELAYYGLPFFNEKRQELHINLNKFEDYLVSQRINMERVDLCLKMQRVLKAKRVPGKYKDKSCVSWKIDKPEIDKEDIILEGQAVDIEDTPVLEDLSEK